MPSLKYTQNFFGYVSLYVSILRQHNQVKLSFLIATKMKVEESFEKNTYWMMRSQMKSMR